MPIWRPRGVSPRRTAVNAQRQPATVPVYIDTSGLIALARIGRLDLMRALADAVRVTDVVWQEATADRGKPGIAELEAGRESGLLEVVPEGERGDFPELDPGEATCLSAAAQVQGAVVIDERKARLFIQSNAELRASLASVTGVIGLLLRAKEARIIEAVAPLLDALDAETFRMSANLRRKLLQAAGELP